MLPYPHAGLETHQGLATCARDEGIRPTRGTYAVHLVVTDASGLTSESATTATITNVPPAVHVDSPAPIVSGDAFTLNATFVDPGIRDMPWRYTIDWSVGSATEGSTNTQSAPITAVSPRYCVAGTHPVTVSVTDKDNGTGTKSITLTVNRIEVPMSVLTQSLQPKARGELPVAVLSTSAFDATKLDVASITLGDGTLAGAPVTRRPNGTTASVLADVNGDGRADLLLHFDREQLSALGVYSAPTTHLVLLGSLTDGCSEVRASADVRTLGG